MPVHRVDLAQAASSVPGERALDRRSRIKAARKPVKDRRAEIAVGHRLGGDRADPGAHERAGGADREGAGGDRDGEGAGGGVVGDDGPGHACGLRSRSGLRGQAKASELAITVERQTVRSHVAVPIVKCFPICRYPFLDARLGLAGGGRRGLDRCLRGFVRSGQCRIGWHRCLLGERIDHRHDDGGGTPLDKRTATATLTPPGVSSPRDGTRCTSASCAKSLAGPSSTVRPVCST